MFTYTARAGVMHSRKGAAGGSGSAVEAMSGDPRSRPCSGSRPCDRNLSRVGCVCSTGRNELKAGGVVDGTTVGQFRGVACADGLYTAAECMHSRQAGCVQEAKDFSACCLGIFEELGLDSSSSFFFFFFLIYPRICQYWTRGSVNLGYKCSCILCLSRFWAYVQ